ncbi:MAG: dihydroorotate oxidase [Chloroflexi bacterium]|nr:dihydroorotate oxidase [Chloroflexota bacterium]
MRLAAEIAGVTFPSCIINASGPLCTTFEELKALGHSASGAIVTKSMTKEARAGNPEPRYYEFPQGSLNSMGLPNLGYQKYAEFIPRLKEFGKPIIASVAGMNGHEYEEIAGYISSKGPDLIEINLSCPNIIGKPQLGYDWEASEAVLKTVRPLVSQPLGVKLPPYFDPIHQEVMAGVLKRARIDFVVVINSVGNALIIDPDTEQVVIRPKDGFGGLGGACIKPVALANVRAFYQLLSEEMPIIGVGGIVSGVDAFEHLLAGASAVAVGTAFAKEGLGIFQRLGEELGQLLKQKGYSSAQGVIGKLRVMDD